jgi:hypothetical protein
MGRAQYVVSWLLPLLDVSPWRSMLSTAASMTGIVTDIWGSVTQCDHRFVGHWADA